MTSPACVGSRAVLAAGERLFIDVTDVLAVPPLRRVMLAVIGHVYQDIGRSLDDRQRAFRDDPWAVFALGPADGWQIKGPVIWPFPWLWRQAGDPARHALRDRARVRELGPAHDARAI